MLLVCYCHYHHSLFQLLIHRLNRGHYYLLMLAEIFSLTMFVGTGSVGHCFHSFLGRTHRGCYIGYNRLDNRDCRDCTHIEDCNYYDGMNTGRYTVVDRLEVQQSIARVFPVLIFLNHSISLATSDESLSETSVQSRALIVFVLEARWSVLCTLLFRVICRHFLSVF